MGKTVRERYLLFALSASLFLLAGLTVAQRAGASSITLKGLTVTPAIANLDLPKGQAAAKFTVVIANSSKNDLALSVSSVDFKSLNDTGGVAFIGSNAAQVAHKYGLASWLDTPPDLELKPNQTKAVAITVENRADLSPGGHYAAVLFSANGNGPNGKNHVAINQVVSTLVFVRKIDGARFGISLQKPALPVSWLHVPTNLDLFFKNTGNIQATPRGLVTITSPLSREVARGIVNTNSSLVLPESTRLDRTAIFYTGSAWLPGRYHVRVAYYYAGSSSLQVYNGSFFFVNVLSIIAGLAILAAVWYIARKARKLYPKKKNRPPSARPPSKQKRIKIQID